jgi:exonuclease SbcC
MKILRLRLENINSIVGKWEIDFANNEFIESGLFSIVGPTGSGKSSILDAITLGLYGQTPRQKSVSSKNEVMTYGTAICSAEVTFEVDGIKYRSYFEQRRAHEKIEGQLQAPRFSLYKLALDETEEPLTEKITETSKKIIELIGLNYEQFTKAVMLPQGAFSRFLTSADDERAKILEQISGSGKYRLLSIRAFEREKKERMLLNSIESEIQATSLLTSEEQKNLESLLLEKETLVKSVRKENTQLQNAVSWLKKIKELETHSLEIEKEIEILKNKEKELAPKKEQCDKARRALEVEGIYTPYKNIQEEIDRKEKEQKKNQEKIESLKKELEAFTEKNTALEKAIEEEEKINASKVDLWDQIIKIDFGIKEKTNIIEACKKDFDLLNRNYKEEERKLIEIKTDWKKECTNFEVAENYISKNKNEESVSSDLEKLNVYFENVEELFNVIQEKKQKHEKQKNELNDIRLGLEKAKESLEKYKSERENFLEQELDSLSTLIREQLQENAPCPVCGSVEHPYLHNKTAESKSNVLDNMERLKKLQEQIEKEQKELIKLEEKSAHSTQEYERAEEEIILLDQKYLNQKNTIEESLKKYTLVFDSVTEIPLLKQRLLKKKENFEKCKALLEHHKDKQNEYNLKEQSIQSALSTFTLQKQKKEEEKNKADLEVSSLQEKRNNLFGKKSVEQDRLEVETKKKNLSNQFRELNLQKNNKEKELSSLKALIESARIELESLCKKQKELEEELSRQLKKAGFESKEQFLLARMDPDECRKIEESIQENQKGLNRKAGEKESIQKSLQLEKEKNLTEKSIDELNLLIEEFEKQNASLQDEIFEFRMKLEKQKENEKKRVSLQASLEKQRHHHRIWDNLNKLIGSAKGDKFSEFVQGITLKMLTINANQHLRKLNPRYFLAAQEKDLSFQLHDNDFGEIRPTSNVSGGEAFQISLALALGLSSMASHRVRLDTLFLDEGFGTLDSKTLQSAISLLSNLRQEEGKLIGVITHVESLKEEIETQINVLPIGNGHSRIQGPGVKKW